MQGKFHDSQWIKSTFWSACDQGDFEYPSLTTKVQRWTVSYETVMFGADSCHLLERVGVVPSARNDPMNSEALRSENIWTFKIHGLYVQLPVQGSSKILVLTRLRLKRRTNPIFFWVSREKTLAADASLFVHGDESSKKASADLSHLSVNDCFWWLRERPGLRCQQLSISLWDWPMGLNVVTATWGIHPGAVYAGRSLQNKSLRCRIWLLYWWTQKGGFNYI